MLKQTLTAIIGGLLLPTIPEASVTTEVLERDSRECVAYARSRVPSLPHGLWDWNDKKNIKNSSKCKKGSVAIIDVGDDTGHLAVVEKCDDSGSSQSIKITETKWKTGYLTQRTAKSSKISKAQSELKIFGYFRP